MREIKQLQRQANHLLRNLLGGFNFDENTVAEFLFHASGSPHAIS